MNRRRLLQLAAALAVASPAAAAPPASALRLADVFDRPDDLRALAARCGPVFSAASTATLMAACGLGKLAEASAQEQLNAFASRRRDDFRAGRIELIDGWIMAHAECALCCLLARS